MVASKISERADVGLHLLPRYGLTVEYMTQTEPTWVPEACTLPTAQQPLRLAEFESSPTDPLHLFLLMKDLRRAIVGS